MRRVDLAASALAPRSIAVVGASDDPHKVGGRPLLYLKRFGYAGAVYPVNAQRPVVQGLPAFPDVESVPVVPELAIVAVAGDAAVRAVEACAARGVAVAIVMASGFGEIADRAGHAAERRLADAARCAGMRLVGPNSQGLANFASGVVASFSTMFIDPEPRDGPVAVVSQSGVMSVVPLALLHREGIGVRYSIATGNEADVTASEMALAAIDDPAVRVLLLYLESIRDPDVLAEAAERARARDVPVVALKSGRSARGRAAARSHTAALANEDRVVDAFLEAHGVWRARDVHDLVRAVPLYLRGWRPPGSRVVIVTNSGASGVMAADTAHALDVPVPALDAATQAALGAALPAFASTANPIDLATVLMSDRDALAKVFPRLAASSPADLYLVSFPVAGEGYDVGAMVDHTAAFATTIGGAVAVATPQPAVASRFRDAAIPTYDNQTSALESLVQLARHAVLMRRRRPRTLVPAVQAPQGLERGALNEAESLDWLGQHGLPVTPYRLCRDEPDLRRAFRELGARVAVKACSRDVPHKTRHGMVTLDVVDEAALLGLASRYRAALDELGASYDGVLVAPMAAGRELAIGAAIDPQFGPVVMLGAGGADVETLNDVVFLLPPFDADDVRRALARVPSMPLAALDLVAVCDLAVRIGGLALATAASVAAIDLNPVLVRGPGKGVTIVDALVVGHDRDGAGRTPPNDAAANRRLA